MTKTEGVTSYLRSPDPGVDELNGDEGLFVVARAVHELFINTLAPQTWFVEGSRVVWVELEPVVPVVSPGRDRSPKEDPEEKPQSSFVGVLVPQDPNDVLGPVESTLSQDNPLPFSSSLPSTSKTSPGR